MTSAVFWLGPISSGSPRGQGPFFSVLFILVGGWMLARMWRDRARRVEKAVPVPAAIGIIGLAVLFILDGVWGLTH